MEPLSLTFRVEKHDGKNATLVLELKNRAGPNQPVLLSQRDHEGRIYVTAMHSLTFRGKQSSGLGGDIMKKCAEFLNALAFLQVEPSHTTFTMLIPVRLCAAPTFSDNENNTLTVQAEPIESPTVSSLQHAIVIDDQSVCRTVLKNKLCCKIGFGRVSTFGETAQSVLDAVSTIANMAFPPQAILVDQTLDIAGLTPDERDGMVLLRGLSQDQRVSGMRVLCSGDDAAATAPEYHCFIPKNAPTFVAQFLQADLATIRFGETSLHCRKVVSGLRC